MIPLALLDGPPEGDSPAARHAAALAEAAGWPAPAYFPVFDGPLTTSPARVAAALDAAREAGARVVNCSFGLARPSPAIAAALARLAETGALVTAAAPARGAACWPAADPHCIAVQGDARCAASEWSHLGLPLAEFGACPRLPSRPEIAGASLAAAAFAGHLARLCAHHSDPLAAARAAAAYRGPERRGTGAAE